MQFSAGLYGADTPFGKLGGRPCPLLDVVFDLCWKFCALANSEAH
jgi:hypothetical protein